MLLKQGENSCDITFICLSMIGVILTVSYILFAYWVTHKGDFYHNRRWRGAVLVAGISSILIPLSFSLVILSVILSSSKSIFELYGTIIALLSRKNLLEIIGLIIGLFFTFLIIVIPYLYVVTLGIHFRIRRSIDSDDYLDKIWKDPNKGHKSPIQEI